MVKSRLSWFFLLLAIGGAGFSLVQAFSGGTRPGKADVVLRSRVDGSRNRPHQVNVRSVQHVVPDANWKENLEKDGEISAVADDKGKLNLEDMTTDQIIKELIKAIGTMSKEKDYGRIAALLDCLLGRKDIKNVLTGLKSADKLLVLGVCESAGAAAAAPALALAGDGDAAVALSAKDLLFKSLQDLSIGDHERAEIVVEASAEYDDADTISRLYQEFVKMRHSVGVETFAKIMENGSDSAKENLPRAMRGFTGDTDIQTVEDALAWFDSHPDTAFDDWFHGPKTGSGVKKLDIKRIRELFNPQP